uniref:Uncharacterized protein n=1 Tax=Romanomermis culicivorax TaxID=13658 RepID=A0A915L736_ROMCU
MEALKEKMTKFERPVQILQDFFDILCKFSDHMIECLEITIYGHKIQI